MVKRIDWKPPGWRYRQSKFLLLLFPSLLLFVFTFAGCDCESEEDDEDDSDNNPSDDDDNDNNNDSTSDDDDNDDNDDDDSTDDDDDDTIEVHFEKITGGVPGDLDTSIAVGFDGTRYVAAAKGGVLYLYTNPPGKSWTREAIDNFGEYPDLKIDDSGYLHMAYYDDFNLTLKYATNQSGTWEITIVDDQGDVGDEPSLALDGNGNPHISYFDFTNKDLKYASKASGTWMIESAVTDGDIGERSSIAIDQGGFAHISCDNYTDFMSYYLLYTTNKSGNWVTKFFGINRFDSSLDLDGNGFVHIAYMKIYSWPPIIELVYTTNASGFWNETIIDSYQDTGWMPSLLVDDDGYIHISYHDEIGLYGHLKYATNESGTWNTETIPHLYSGEGFYSSLVLDFQGYTQISHHNWHEDFLHVTNNSSGSWVTETLDDSGTYYTYPSISLNSNNFPYVFSLNEDDINLIQFVKNDDNWETSIFVDDTIGYSNVFLDKDDYFHLGCIQTSGLNYLTNRSGSWESDLVDLNGFGNPNISLDLNSDGNAFFAYSSVNGLMYATNESGGWETENLNSLNTDKSLAVDQDGFSHICFSGNYELYYTSNEFGSWNDELLHSDGNTIDYYCSIKLDSNNDTHMCYLNYRSELFYGHNSSGSWTIEMLPVYIHSAPKLIIDDDNYIHILSRTLYITNLDGSWNSSEILPFTTISYFSLDREDMFHSVFAHEGAFWYGRFQLSYIEAYR